MTLISGRAAVEVLSGVGVPPAQAQVALAAGLAGRPGQVGRMLGYDLRRVDELASREIVAPDTVPTVCQRGMLVLRAPRGLDPRSPWSPDELFRRDWPLAASARWTLKARARREPVPCLVTAAGFVAAGVDIVGAGVLDGRTRLETAPAGGWWASFAGKRFPTGPGTSWVWWPPPVTHDRIRLERGRSRLRRD